MNADKEGKFCGNCGEKLLPDDEFCPKCGNSLNQEKNPELKQTSNYNKNTSNEIHCPYCESKIQNYVSKCRHCGEWIDKSKDPSISNQINFFNNKFAIIGIIVFVIFFMVQLSQSNAYYVTHATFNIIFWGFAFIMIMLVLILGKIK